MSPPKKQPAMNDRAAQLYTAAVELFIERGYRNVDVSDIAARCGVSHGTFYNYFRSKRDLLDAILNRTTEELAATLGGPGEAAARAGRAAYVAELAARVRRAIDYIVANRALISFTLVTAPGVDEQAYAAAVAAYDNLGTQVAAFLAEGRKYGWVRGDGDLQTVALAVVSCVVAATLPALLDIDAGTDVDAVQVAEACTAFLLGGVRSELLNP